MANVLFSQLLPCIPHPSPLLSLESGTPFFKDKQVFYYYF